MPALDTADGDEGVAIRNLSFQTVFQLDSILVKPSRCELVTAAPELLHCAGSAGLVVVDLRTTDGSIPFASSSLREASMIAAISVAMELMLPCMELMLPCMELMLPSMEVTLVSNCIARGIAVEVEGVESP
ncbi:hypothetical protein F2Q69_00006176 [Brassica cretica]|uniref:Uncharacterized protein n=1 Tax=Brassica cretica TaxID=69181 RepID=A0A8S9P1W1_BRACR|nr:hypothetical protein F2Q69_00006176 [Brassica cretica]